MVHIIEDVFTLSQVSILKGLINSSMRTVDVKYGRYISSIKTFNSATHEDRDIIIPDDIHERLYELAADNFSKTAKQSYIKAAKYSGFLNPSPSLPAHLDDNACSYTIDYQLSSNVDWSLYVNGEEVSLKDNCAVVYDGENELHWRGNFPSSNPMSFVHMIFFHFVEPEHWYFKIPSVNSEQREHLHDARLQREAPLLIKYGKQEGTENKYVR